MKNLEKLKAWLQTCPGWEESLQVEFLEPTPGHASLFPEGMEIRSRQEDVLGNRWVNCRYRFTIYRQTMWQEDSADAAQWLLEFQDWVQQQSAAGLAPYFGDLPQEEFLQAQKGTLKQAGQTKLYTVTLIADFVRLYPAA